MSMVSDSEYKCLLDEKTLKKAKDELGEREKTRLLEVRNLRKRVEKVPGLRARTDINFLLKFLRVRKFDQEKAFESVKKYYQMKGDHPEVFDDLKPSREKQLLETGCIEVLENRDKQGCRVFVIRLAKLDYSRFTVMDTLKILALCLIQLQEDEENQIHGIHIIYDMADTPLSTMLHWTPNVIKIAANVMQNMVPLRLKRIDYVHVSTFFSQIFAIIKLFLKDKILQRVCFNDDTYEGLHSTMDPDYLPSDMGGKLEPYGYTGWIDDLMNSDKQFEEDNKYGYVSMGLSNDKKETSKQDAGLEGLGGTFKKLEV